MSTTGIVGPVQWLYDAMAAVPSPQMPRAGCGLLVSVGPLLAIFCFLFGRAAAVSAGDILFLLCLGLYLAVVVSVLLACGAKDDAAACDDVVDVHVGMVSGEW